MAALVDVEAEMGAKLGDGNNPLLLSVRSGAAVSTTLTLSHAYHPAMFCIESVHSNSFTVFPVLKSQVCASLQCRTHFHKDVRLLLQVSMPGMMDTVLNLGLNDTVVEGLASKAGERFAFDAYRRFLDMFGDVVMGVSHSLFEEQMHALKVCHVHACTTQSVFDAKSVFCSSIDLVMLPFVTEVLMYRLGELGWYVFSVTL